MVKIFSFPNESMFLIISHLHTQTILTKIPRNESVIKEEKE